MKESITLRKLRLHIEHSLSVSVQRIMEFSNYSSIEETPADIPSTAVKPWHCTIEVIPALAFQYCSDALAFHY